MLTLLLFACAKDRQVVQPFQLEPDEVSWELAAPPADDAIYFVMVDRYANGDPSNDEDTNLADAQAWFGGDLRGLIEHLDDIQELGFRTVWISPVFRSRDAKFHEWGAYHGYWVEDPRKVEPRFGEEGDLVELSEELHRRDMRLVMDMVYNHLSFDAPLVAQHPGWVHGLGDIEDWDDPEEVVTHDVHGLPDLAQEDPEVYDFLMSATRRWLHLVRPDGFRVDAVRHLPAEFLAAASADIRAEVGDDFALLGELFEGDPVKLSEAARSGSFSHLFDFPLHYAMSDVFCGEAGAGRLASTLSSDRLYPDPGALVTFLDNHDLPRIAGVCERDQQRVAAALAFLMTARGTPCVTYGTESMLFGTEEPANRAKMRFDYTPLADTIQELLALRRAHPALTGGEDRLLFLDDELFVYARVAGGEAAVIAVNTGEAPRTATLPEGWGPASVAVGPDAPSPDGRGVAVDPGGVTVAFVADPPALPPLPEAAAVRVSASGAPPGSLRLVGASPELGGWDPAAAPAFEGGALELSWPAGAVLEAKLVVVGDQGGVTWQDGANTTALIQGDQELSLTW